MQDMNYTHTETEFQEMRRLLVDSYRQDHRPFNWRLAMADNWNYASRYLEPLDFFTSRVHLWRNAAGELAGFTIRDHGLTYFEVAYRYRQIEAEMAAWAEASWGGEKALIHTMVYDWDHERQSLLAQRGYENRGAIEDVRVYDLSRTYPDPVLPPGYRFTSMREFTDVTARVALEKRMWNDSVDEAWFRGKSSAPAYSPAWDLMVLSPAGEPAASCLLWCYPETQSAEIDPLATDPDHRQRGLAKALVLESFRRMRAEGYRLAYIASETQDPVVSHLYSSLQPVELYQGCHWRWQGIPDGGTTEP